MQFVKGQKGGPGIPKGTITRNSRAAWLLMEANNFNPVLELINRFRDPTLSEKTHNFCLKQLVERYAPVLKHTEIEGNITSTEQSISFVITVPGEAKITPKADPLIVQERSINVPFQSEQAPIQFEDDD